MRRGRLGYVPALDGIRGVAILAVVAYHFLGLPGGFFGVDLFFVLSGFLITTLLIEERDATGGVSLRAFYARRARRLLPALGGVFAITALFGILAFAVGKEHLGALSFAGIVACALFAGNLVRMAGAHLPLELTPLWSLAQEEQFYLVWPAVFLAFRGRPARLAAALFAVAMAVICWRAFLVFQGGFTPHVHYGPDTRCDGLLIGAALAAARSAGLLARVRLSSVWAWAGLAAFAAATAVHAGAAAYAVALPLVALIGVILVLVAVEHGSRLLAWRPLVWTGSISYGLYVWQATVFLFLGRGVVGALVAIVAGWGSTRWLERRFRRKKKTRNERARVSPAPRSALLPSG